MEDVPHELPQFDVGLVLRAARRLADLSQAQLAAAVGLSQPCVATYETGSRHVAAEDLDTLLRACGCRLVALDADGEVVCATDDGRRDRGGRRYPAHLDVRRTGERGDWWGDYYPGVWGVPPRPVWTFHVDRRYRNSRRREDDPPPTRGLETGRPPQRPALGSPPMDDAALLETFDAQVRRRPGPHAGLTVELVDDPGPVLRLTPTGPGATWGGGVFWSGLDAATADATIAAQVEHFRPNGQEWEWKHYAYDRPADLPDRLRAAGFEPEDDEALVIGEVAEVRERLASAPAPQGVTLRKLRADAEGRAADWAAIGALHQEIWDEDATDYVTSLSAAYAGDPTAMTVWLAEADDGTVVCSARAEFHEGTDFASLWGGGTLEAYRGRGIYKALVAVRADEAAERGYRFLQVDASPDSRPILERLGLRTLTTTTPWMWRP